MLLRDWLPDSFFNEFEDSPVNKFLDVVILDDYGYDAKPFSFHPFKHKCIFNWVKLENGYAVGWNENPAIGWSFPIVKLKSDKK